MPTRESGAQQKPKKKPKKVQPPPGLIGPTKPEPRPYRPSTEDKMASVFTGKYIAPKPWEQVPPRAPAPPPLSEHALDARRAAVPLPPPRPSLLPTVSKQYRLSQKAQVNPIPRQRLLSTVTPQERRQTVERLTAPSMRQRMEAQYARQKPRIDPLGTDIYDFARKTAVPFLLRDDVTPAAKWLYGHPGQAARGVTQFLGGEDPTRLLHPIRAVQADLAKREQAQRDYMKWRRNHPNAPASDFMRTQKAVTGMVPWFGPIRGVLGDILKSTIPRATAKAAAGNILIKGAARDEAHVLVDDLLWNQTKATRARAKQGLDAMVHNETEGLGPAERSAAAHQRWRELGNDLKKGAEVPEIPLERATKGVDMGVFREHGVEGFVGDLPRMLKAGQIGRFWYEESAREILRLAGGDKKQATKYLQVLAIYSAQRNPRENVNLLSEVLRQWQTTGKIAIGDTKQIRKATDVMMGKQWEGRKTDRFYKNMLEDVDPVRFKKEFGGTGREVANDIWMARLFGLKTDVPTPREYAAMEKVIQNIADELGWKPKQVQAALWGPVRSERAQAKATAMTVEEGAQSFLHAFQQESAMAPFETAPGIGTLGREAYDTYKAIAPEARRAFDGEINDAVSTFLRDSESFAAVSGKGQGLYESQTNPAYTVLMPTKYTLDPKAKEPGFGLRGLQAVDGVTTAIADALHQDAAAWFRPKYAKSIPVSKQNGTHVSGLDRELSEQEIVTLHQRLTEEMGGDVAIPPGAGDAFYVLNFSKTANKNFQAAVDNALNEMFPEVELQTRGFLSEGRYHTRRADGSYAHQQTAWAKRPAVQRSLARLRDSVDGAYDRHLGIGWERTGTARGDTGLRRAARRLASEETGSIDFGAFRRRPKAPPSAPEKPTWNVPPPKAGQSWVERQEELVRAGLSKQDARLVRANENVIATRRQRVTDARNPQQRAHAEMRLHQAEETHLALLAKLNEDLVPLRQQVAGRTPGTKSQYGKERKVRSHEAGRRVATKRERYQAEVEMGTSPRDAHLRSKQELAGEYPKLVYKGFSHLDDEAQNALIADIYASNLQEFEKTNAADAILDAVEGKIPRPSRIKLLEQVFPKETVESIKESASAWEKRKEILYQVGGIPRSLQSTLDLSALLRQNLVAGIRHPGMTARNIGPMLKSMAKQENYDALRAEIASRPSYGEMNQYKLALTDMESLGSREEAHISPLVEKAPKILGGGLIRGSSRAYSGLLNKMRADMWDALAPEAKKAAEETGRSVDKELRDLARYINAATGRAGLGNLEQHAVLANMALFSPRLLSSRLAFLNPR